MKEKIVGKCKYCGKEYTKGYMMRHLRSCKERKARLESEKGTKKCRYYQLEIYARYDKRYWLFIEIREDATLRKLDQFLRDIWLECCGHLSAFQIDGTRYEVCPYDDPVFDFSCKGMDYKLDEVIEEGMVISYEYDFGSTTDLMIKVAGVRDGVKTREDITILSRNNAYEWMCDNCHTNKATNICSCCAYEEENMFCDECGKEHECGEDMLLPVCNSPRMGVCGYCGSEIYPDQFVPDKI